MTATYEIAKTTSRDGIRTRKNGDVAFARLEVRGEDGREFSLMIQTREGDPAVFRADVDRRSGVGVLTAMTPEAVAIVAAAIEADRARLQSLADLDAALNEEFGSISIGSPAQIAHARTKRAMLAARVRDFMVNLAIYCEDSPAELEDELRGMIPQLYPVATFWLECAGDLLDQVGRWLENRESSASTINRARAQVGL